MCSNRKIISPNDLIKSWSEYIEWNSISADDMSADQKTGLIRDRIVRYEIIWEQRPEVVLNWVERAIKFLYT